MLTAVEIENISAELRGGDTPEKIAERRGMSRSGLILALLHCGKRIVLRPERYLEDTVVPAGEPRELAAVQ